MKELLEEANKEIVALKEEIKKRDIIVNSLVKQIEELKSQRLEQ